MGTKQKIIVVTAIAVTLLLLSTLGSKVFAAITTPMTLRGDDGFGSGAFGASRDGNTRDHNGIDLIAAPGQDIFSPIAGTVTRLAYPYSGNTTYTGLEIVNDTYSIKIFYITPKIVIGSIVKAGQRIASAQNIAAKYPGIINHVHFEVRDSKGQLLNPTNMF